MKKSLWIGGLVLLLAGPALADLVYYPPSVTGARERRYLRHFLYVQNLTGDKRFVYAEYGYTPHRVRINAAGEMKEQWTYPEHGLQFVFDHCSRLTETRQVEREDRRSWAYQRHGESTYGALFTETPIDCDHE